MPDDSDAPHRFRLIRGRGNAEHRLGRVVVTAYRGGAAPVHPVDAVVLEEDTWLTVSAPPELRVPVEPLIRVMTELLTWTPKEPGSLIVRRGRPTRLLAVVYDFSQEPASRVEWVTAALDRILDPPGRRPLRRIAMPLLGARHGGLEPRIFVALLRKACERARETPVLEIHLQLDDGVDPAVLDALDDPFGERS